MGREWKKEMEQNLKPLTPSLLPSRPSTTGFLHAGVMKLILFGSLAAGIIVKLLPYEYTDRGDPVPTGIFKGLPVTTFHVFVISIIFSFAGAFSSLLTSGRPKNANYEKFCRYYSLVFSALAIAILVRAAIRLTFRWAPIVDD
ncbi:hypothetical protein JCGZ_05719 [Jatropha curcas]|uniref:CASP-like protein n=1 Tax=Jatropha curcas TaxID=180498 RepID=A0A067L790_JATCU|nr:hypothetical protein JCGZ_05719 [Jatropha curcas]